MANQDANSGWSDIAMSLGGGPANKPGASEGGSYGTA